MPEIHGNAQPISCTVSNAVGHLFLFKYESKNGIFVQQSRCAASETSSALLRNQPLAAHRKTAGAQQLAGFLCKFCCSETLLTCCRYAQEYNYVGGFYEGCNEEKIMEEIYNHGCGCPPTASATSLIPFP